MGLFLEKLQSVVHECVPEVRISNNGKLNPPCFNIAAKRCVKRTYFAWKRYTETRSYFRYKEYCNVRNKVAKKKLCQIKREYEKNLVAKVKNNYKAFYMYVNSKIACKSSVSRLKSDNGLQTSNDLETAEELDSFNMYMFVKMIGTCCTSTILCTSQTIY